MIKQHTATTTVLAAYCSCQQQRVKGSAHSCRTMAPYQQQLLTEGLVLSLYSFCSTL